MGMTTKSGKSCKAKRVSGNGDSGAATAPFDNNDDNVRKLEGRKPEVADPARKPRAPAKEAQNDSGEDRKPRLQLTLPGANGH